MHLASSLLCDLGIGWSVGRGQSIMISIGVGTGGQGAGGRMDGNNIYGTLQDCLLHS